MFEPVATFLLALRQSSPVVFLGLAIATGISLVAPDFLLSGLGLSQLRDQYRPYLGGAFLVSSSVLAAHGLIALGRYAGTRLDKRRDERDAEKALEYRCQALHSLTPDEKAYLIPFVLEGKNTLYFKIEDGVAAGLVAKDILYQPSSVGSMISGFAHNIQPWAEEYLQEHRELLEGANPRPTGPPTG